MDETLRREVRFLTTRLGKIVEELSGPQVFAAIEHLRTLSKQIRQSPEHGLVAEIEEQVNRLTLRQATDVAHAFSLFFHLVNLCEERQRVRRLREYERHEAGAPMSLRRTFTELRRRGIAFSALRRLLTSMRVEPVLTAHPTEAKRRSVLNHILEIDKILEGFCGEIGPEAERAVNPLIEALWNTDETRETAVTPQMESENARFFLERTIYGLAGPFWEKFCSEMQRFTSVPLDPAPVFGFGSWVGTDRDGNPNITPETSLEAAEEVRRSILRHYRRRGERLLDLVSLPCRSPRSARLLRREIARDVRRFPALRALQRLDQPSELYRRKQRVINWKIEQTIARAPGAYADPSEFVADLLALERLVAKHPSPRVAGLGLRRLRVAAQVFGFHGASLDFRNHASATRAAAEEILRAARLPTHPATARVEAIQRLLLGSRLSRSFSGATRLTLKEMAALKTIQARNGEAAAHRYVLSMTSTAADVWDVLLLGRQADLIAARQGQLTSSFDVIPLFETFLDLEACPQVLDQLLGDPLYRGLLRSRGNFQEVMLGYSDSVKDSGYLAANFALFRASLRLGQVAERHGIRLSLFHGKGGTIDRGGGQSYRSLHAQPSAAPGGRMRITEQGEVVSLKYANPAIAERNLEQLVTSVLDAHLLATEETPAEKAAEWESHAEELARSSREFYRHLVYENREFAHYFRQATPVDLIERLRLGSRPSHRTAANDLADLRAIPWVFAWTQSRHFLPAWYGLGYALEEFMADHGARGLELLQAMFQGWPFFALLLENAEMSLAKTDLYIARRYALLVEPPAVGQRIFQLIEEEFERTVRAVLAVSGRKHLLANQPVLAESIRLRNPYVDPLNFLQVRFLKRWRRMGKRERDKSDLLRLLQITVGGIAFGMKSTG